MGGDLIDVVVHEGRLDILLGDVSGHGLGAGVVMAMLKSCVRTRLLHDASLEEVVADANRVLADLTESNMFATFAAPVRLKYVVDEVVRVHVADQHDIAAAPAIPAVRAAPRFVLLAPETDTAPPSITRGKLHCAFVDKHSVHDAERATFAKGLCNPAKWLSARGPAALNRLEAGRARAARCPFTTKS
jgi:hypothetical protein